MPGYAFGFSTVVSWFARTFLRHLNWGPKLAKSQAEDVRNAPDLAVVATAGDDRDAWLAAGRAIASIGLHGARRGIALSFFNQPIELPQLRPQLAAIACPHFTPQLLIRLGSGPETRATPRRIADDVLTSGSAHHTRT